MRMFIFYDEVTGAPKSHIRLRDEPNFGEADNFIEVPDGTVFSGKRVNLETLQLEEMQNDF